MNKHQISNLIKKIKLETNETTNPNPSASPTPIVDTYFAAKMADRVSCDICHKVNSFVFAFPLSNSFEFFSASLQ